jgi:hypothetical protein
VRAWAPVPVLDVALVGTALGPDATAGTPVFMTLTATTEGPAAMARLDLYHWPSLARFYSQDVQAGTTLVAVRLGRIGRGAAVMCMSHARWRLQTSTPIQAYIEPVWPKHHAIDNDDDEEEVSTLVGVPELHVRVLSEAVPMQQFQHLIKKRDFDGAAAFARLHRMDAQVRGMSYVTAGRGARG